MNVAVNGVAVEADRWPSPEVAAVRELLRQRALALGLLPSENADDDAIDAAIERLLAQEAPVPRPTDKECRRYYEAHRQEFSSGDLVYARHILFQVTPLAPVAENRARAENSLIEVLREPESFERLARELSNCPSGQQGGILGLIARGDTAPEFEQAVFRNGPTGILRELVRTRYGFHIVAVDQRPWRNAAVRIGLGPRRGSPECQGRGARPAPVCVDPGG
jgi:peptidyl-prolyl cis-trans isomerase C